ncbi:MAG: LPS export ABC transporter permease LptF [Variibacter sp.]|nr:LPS export ABC transporter permease LptF [Variibacter sp.]
MGAIGRYIVRTTLGAFMLIFVSLTAVVWVTHALRELDLVTNQAQTIFAFIGLTSLLIPFLGLIVAPIALMVAVAYALNKLNTDSEIVVMNAAGISPWRIFWPFLFVGLLTAITIAFIGAYFGPKCLRELRTQLTKARADLIANIMQPGKFTALDGGRLTFHVRERKANGDLAGIFIEDRRDPAQRSTYLAELGRVVENANGTFMLLQQGSAQRLEMKERDPTIVVFERYAFDLSQFSGGEPNVTFNMAERYIWELLRPDPGDAYMAANSGRVWAELNDRLAAPLYPIVFIIIGFAILGAPRTSRQSRGLSMLMTIVTVAAVRLLGFASVVLAARTPAAAVILYVALATATVGGLIMISRGTIIEPPAFLVDFLGRLQRLRPAAKPRALGGAPA